MMPYRIKAAIDVLLGKSRAVKKKGKEIHYKNVPFSSEEQNFLNSISIEFLFSEFGENRTNGGGSDLSNQQRLDPTLKTLKKYFPNAKYTVYSDFDIQIEGVTLKKVQSPVINSEHERFGYRTADYFKFKALTESTADFKCIMDSDMYVVSSHIIALLYLTQKFGFCVPYNNRQSFVKDTRFSKDTQPNYSDESKLLGHSYNQTPMTLWKDNKKGIEFYETCADIMKTDPSRASLVMWKTAWKTGIYPYILPKEWCVCEGDEGVDDEVILHVGHQKIKEYYNL